MKRIITLLASAALIASGFSLVPAAAQEAPVIPAVVQIDDPVGDANGLNDQDNAYGTPLQGQGDHVGPVGGTATDLGKVWFTNTATEVTLNFQTMGDPSNLAYDTYFRFGSNPGSGGVATDETRGCFLWVASVNGAVGAYSGETEGTLTDKCNVGDPVAGPLVISGGPDGTFITSITFPRSYSPLLAPGQTITAPFGVSRIVYVGPSPTTAAVVTLDNTARGTDYSFVEEGVSTTPPGKTDPPGKKKGCTKGKGKKRGCEGKGKKAPKTGKPSKAKSCTPIAPATAGAEAPHVTLTDAHNAEAPLVQPVELEQRFDEGLTGATPSSVNVTVDTAKKEVGLYATLEFPTRRDYDLWAYFPGTENEEAASSHGFNPLAETQGINDNPDPSNTASNHGGETTASSENLVGILTPDCGGYTVSAYNYFGEGGELELKLWLGDVSYDPAEAGGERAVLSIYDSMLAFI